MAEDPALNGEPQATAGDHRVEEGTRGRSPDRSDDGGTADPATTEAEAARSDEPDADVSDIRTAPERVEVTESDDNGGPTARDADRSLAEPEAVAEATLEVAPDADDRPPADVRNYARFSKMDGATYERVNGFLRDRTYITAREWAIARLCADFRTETGVEMTKIGNHLPELVPFMTDTYSPQAVNQARHSFENKVTKAGSTFLYGAMCDFFTSEELDDLMYEVTEVAKFLLEVEGAELSVDEELDTEERIMEVMREVRHSSRDLRAEELGHAYDQCPHCGHELSDE